MMIANSDAGGIADTLLPYQPTALLAATELLDPV